MPGGSMELLKDNVAVVTGASKGIGYAIARLFSENAACVYLLDIDETKAEEAAWEIHAATGFVTIALHVDVTRSMEVENAVHSIMARSGRVDVLVNNAGILKRALILDMEEKDWDQVFDVNVKGAFLCTKAVGKVMKEQRRGSIINISSCAGKTPTAMQGAYCASKSALIGLTRVTALELGPFGIRCNAICPGITDTEMSRDFLLTDQESVRIWTEKSALKRIGRPEDQARVALFLASELAGHITGESLIVSGGECMGQ
jgi:NAD(P)-dependent dehydrogenase (short-subunit alcohol dehydrogenase family)